MAVASPEQVASSKGRDWTVYEIPPSAFRREDEAFDFPDITFGDNFVYLTANQMKHGGALIIPTTIGPSNGAGGHYAREDCVAAATCARRPPAKSRRGRATSSFERNRRQAQTSTLYCFSKRGCVARGLPRA